ncbi:MAG TPA: sigma-70 family RNA polymerase sigma factor [Nocardioides sp.]|nr:sigma-70 family RNA polymerase sigma factor [Nocardioides sp.]
MTWERSDVARGLDALRAAVLAALTLEPSPALALAGVPAGPVGRAPRSDSRWLMSEAHAEVPGDGYDRGAAQGGYGDATLATSSEDSPEARERLIGLVDLARGGDAEAFGLLYDHYQPSVYRFLYYRTRSVVVAEDLCSETFFRALRNMPSFRWQDKDFGAWLMTIARNLATDHFKAGHTRLELTTEDMGQHDDATEGPENAVLASLTNEILLEALTKLPNEQRDCLIMRFLQGLSIAETAAALGRSDGAIKQLQLRGVRNLAKLMPEGIR